MPAERFGRSHIGGYSIYGLGLMSFRVEDSISSSLRRLCFVRPHRPEFSLLSGPTLTLNASPAATAAVATFAALAATFIWHCGKD